VEHIDGELMLDLNIMLEFFHIVLYSFLEPLLKVIRSLSFKGSI